MLSMTANVASASDDVANIGHALAALIWPAIVILALFLFRKPLAAAIGRVSEVAVGTTKVVLQGQADSAANTTKAVLGTGTGAPASSSEIADASAKASNNPAGAVLDAWSVVEDATRKAAQAAPGVSSPSVPEVVNSLIPKGLDSSLVPVAKNLESLRSVAASNAKVISPATAKSFVAAADDLARMIGKVI
jgi:hypothetical protein